MYKNRTLKDAVSGIGKGNKGKSHLHVLPCNSPPIPNLGGEKERQKAWMLCFAQHDDTEPTFRYFAKKKGLLFKTTARENKTQRLVTNLSAC